MFFIINYDIRKYMSEKKFTFSFQSYECKLDEANSLGGSEFILFEFHLRPFQIINVVKKKRISYNTIVLLLQRTTNSLVDLGFVFLLRYFFL